MVPSDTHEETHEEDVRSAALLTDSSDTAAEAQAEAPPRPEASRDRIQTRVVIASTLDGIGFAPCPSDPGLYVSAPIRDPAVFMRLCSIPEFERATVSADDLAGVDQAIIVLGAAETDRQRADGYEVTALKRTVDELTRANYALSTERDEIRAERDELKRQHDGSEVARLQQLVAQLRRETDQGGGASLALQTENDQLRQANAILTDELATLKNKAA